jgi:hypothetical protein
MDPLKPGEVMVVLQRRDAQALQSGLTTLLLAIPESTLPDDVEAWVHRVLTAVETALVSPATQENGDQRP